jgi:hypothetical protein
MKYIINEKKYDLIFKEYLNDMFSNFKISIFLKPKTSKNPLKNGRIDFKLNGKLKATVFFSINLYVSINNSVFVMSSPSLVCVNSV